MAALESLQFLNQLHLGKWFGKPAAALLVFIFIFYFIYLFFNQFGSGT